MHSGHRIYKHLKISDTSFFRLHSRRLIETQPLLIRFTVTCTGSGSASRICNYNSAGKLTINYCNSLA